MWKSFARDCISRPSSGVTACVASRAAGGRRSTAPMKDQRALKNPKRASAPRSASLRVRTRARPASARRAHGDRVSREKDALGKAVHECTIRGMPRRRGARSARRSGNCRYEWSLAIGDGDGEHCERTMMMMRCCWERRRQMRHGARREENFESRGRSVEACSDKIIYIFSHVSPSSTASLPPLATKSSTSASRAGCSDTCR